MLVARGHGYVGPTLRYAVRALAGLLYKKQSSVQQTSVAIYSPGKIHAENNGFSAARSLVSVVASCS